MDKYINSNWFIKLISLLLALLLFTSVNIDNQVNKYDSSSLGLTDVTEKIKDVPVQAKYDYNNLVVSGLPEKVSLTLKGSNSIVKTTILERDYQVYVDLSNLPLGEHSVALQYRNISDNLKVKIYPETVNITISEKVTKKFPVQVEFINEDKLAEGHKVEVPIIKPAEIPIVGAKELVEEIVSVKAFVDLDGMEQTFSRNIKIRAYDKNGEELELTLDPSSVNITIPIVSPNKVVPIEYRTVGTLPSNLEDLFIEVIPRELTIYGPMDRLNEINKIEIEDINLSNIKESTEIFAKVLIPNGLEKVFPEKVTVKVSVKKMMSKTISDIPIQLQGVGNEYTTEFLSPSTEKLSLTIYGESSIVDKLSKSDFSAVVNVTPLQVGEFEFPIQLSGPDGIELDSDITKVKLKIDKINTQ